MYVCERYVSEMYLYVYDKYVYDTQAYLRFSQRTLNMFVGVVALRYDHMISECHNFHKHSQSPLTMYAYDI